MLIFTDPKSWKYVQSDNMVADISTRHGVSIQDVGPGWMKEDVSQFPMKTLDEIKMSSKEFQASRNELISCNEDLLKFEWPQVALPDNFTAYSTQHSVPSNVCSGYEFSRYIIDPNKHRFKTAVRIIALLKLFIKNFICRYSKAKNTNDSRE